MDKRAAMQPVVGVSRPRPTRPGVQRRLLALSEAALMLGRSPRTLRRWIEAGTLPAHRLGGQLMVKPEDIAALIERGRVNPQLGTAPKLSV